MALRSIFDVPAPAKLNLFLHVVGRRPDGYHLLQSPFVLIDWADSLHVEVRSDGRLVRHDLGLPLPADDLCLRAARALQSHSGTALGADISILKQVPWGAGLGGGSSDAASTLLALNRLWGLGWPRERLAAIGLLLGADVPFFIGGNNAFVEGIGERLTPIELPPMMFAVVKPDEAIATRDIFTHPGLIRDTEPVILAGYLEHVKQEAEGGISRPISQGMVHGKVQKQAQGFGRNDLQGPAQAVCAAVVEVAHWLEARFGNSRMTGSGSAVFSRVVSDSGKADAPLATFPGAELAPGWVGRMCRSLPEHPLRGWAD
jgi:4-diphosphocytidyl-2-C-methyl-D-erythritol kinase